MMNDPQFPHLEAALEPARIQNLLQLALLSAHSNDRQEYVVDACLIGEKRYKPGKSCVLSYDLHLRNKGTGSSRVQVVSARLCRPMEGLPEFHQANRRKLSLTPGLEPLGYLPETEMVVWTFPNDRKLTSLPQLLDAQYLTAHLAPKLEAMGLDHSCKITAIDPTILHYLPERSCMIRYHVAIQFQSTGVRSVVIIYGKTYRDDSGAETYSVMRQLTRQLPGIAIPLAYDQELRTLWQSHVPGESLVWEMLEPDGPLSVLHAMGQCLAEFHSCHVQTSSRFGMPDIEGSLRETIEVARRTYPEMTNRIQSIVNRLLARRNSIDWSNQPITPIHRDLKMSNFLIDSEKLRLIDMDCVSTGDPLTDIASLITNLHLNGIHAGNSSRSTSEIVEAFHSAYTEVVSHAVSVPHLNWYTAAAFIHESTRRSIRQLDIERLKHVAEYLELSEYYLSA
jgi:aminoglycoside phosphotransferase (APT) family kinase protein